MAQAEAQVARRKTQTKVQRVHVLLPEEMVNALDQFAVDQSNVRVWQPPRSDAIRQLLFEGLKKRGYLKD